MMKQRKKAHESQIVRAIKISSWAMEDPAKDKHQAPTDRLRLYVRAAIELGAGPTIVHLKMKHCYKSKKDSKDQETMQSSTGYQMRK